jgi:hypothetical protein
MPQIPRSRYLLGTILASASITPWSAAQRALSYSDIVSCSLHSFSTAAGVSQRRASVCLLIYRLLIFLGLQGVSRGRKLAFRLKLAVALCIAGILGAEAILFGGPLAFTLGCCIEGLAWMLTALFLWRSRLGVSLDLASNAATSESLSFVAILMLMTGSCRPRAVYPNMLYHRAVCLGVPHIHTTA